MRGPARVSGSKNPSGNASMVFPEKRRGTTNAMEIVKIDKFNSGKKQELLDQAI
jgi:hypothetical protein